MFARSLLVGFCSFCLAAPLFGQAPGTFDLNFQTPPGSDSPPGYLVSAGGKIYASGSFTNYSGQGKAGLVRLELDGTIDPGFDFARPILINEPVILNGTVLVPGSTNNGAVTAFVVRPDRRIVFIGHFTHAGGVKLPKKGIGLVNEDGALAGFGSELGDLEPEAVLNGPGDTVYVGGKKNATGGAPLALLRLNPDGARDGTFAPPTLDSLGYVVATVAGLVPGPDGKIYAKVAALMAGAPNIEIVRLNSDGSLDTAFADQGRAGCGASLQLNVFAGAGGNLMLNGPGKYRGVTLQNPINQLLPNGGFDPAFVPPGGLNIVSGGAVQPDGKVLIIGSSLGAVARLNPDGSKDGTYVDPAKVPASQFFLPTKLLLGPDGAAYVSATRLTSAFQTVQGVFRVFGDPNSAPVIAVQPAPQTNSAGARTRFNVQARGAAPFTYQWYRGNAPLAGASDADFILSPTMPADAGEYHCVVSNALGASESAKALLTVLEQTPGSVFRETDVPAGPDSAVADLAFDSAGGLWAAGNFARWNGTNRLRVARLGPDSANLDLTVDTGAWQGTLGGFLHVLPLPAGKALAIGDATTAYNGRAHSGVFRLAPTGAIDVTFNPLNAGNPGLAGFSLSRPAVGPDGKPVFLANAWNDEKFDSSFIRLNEDGTRDTAFALGGSAYAFASDAIEALPDGRYLIAARPSSAGPNGSAVMRLAADGSVDGTFFSGGPYTRTDGPYDFALQPDGRTIVAGGFTIRSGGAELSVGLIRLLPDGRPDPEFNPVPILSARPGFTLAGLRRIALQADGRIVALGENERSIFRFWPNGVLDPSFAGGLNLAGSQMSLGALAVRPDNAILIGGSFTSIGGLPRTNFARINGGVLQPQVAPPGIASQSRREVAKAGGSVTLSVEPSGSGPFLFQWRRNQNTGSTNWVDIPGATNATLGLPNLKALPQDSGLFQVAVVNPGGCVWSDYVTLLVEPSPAPDGTPDTSLNITEPFLGILTGQEQIFALSEGQKLYGAVNSTVRRHHEDGTIDLTFQAPADLISQGGGVAAILRQPDGKLLVAGRLKDGLLARLLEDGAYDPAFIRTNGYTGFFQNVPHSLAVQSDRKIVLAGTFENLNGRPANGLARFHPDGRVDESFPLGALEMVLPNPERTLPGGAVSIRMLPDDRFYVGGSFTRVHGVPRFGIARLLKDGGLDTSFAPPTDGSSSAGLGGRMQFYTAGPLAPDGGLYIFGSFLRQDNQPPETILKLRADGSIDAGFKFASDFQVNNGTLQSDGKLVVSGQFTAAQGVGVPNLIRLNLDGSLDATWARGGTGSGVGIAMATWPDGKIQLGHRRLLSSAAPVARIAFALTGQSLSLSWPDGFKLQRTASLNPAVWTDVGAPSPFATPPAGPTGFFRALRVEP